MIQIIQASTPGQFASGRRLFDEYAASLPFDLDFQDFATELRNLRNIYSPPNGALLLAVDAAYGHDSNAARAGCIALRELEQSDDGIRTGEVKRLYVPDEYRGSEDSKMGWPVSRAGASAGDHQPSASAADR